MPFGEMLDSTQESITDTFGMIGASVDFNTDAPLDPSASVIATIGLGSPEGEAVVNVLLSRESAESIVEWMLSEKPENEGVVLDGVGELAQLIAGGIKTKLGSDELTLGLPSVVAGSDIRLSQTNAAETHSFEFVVDGEHRVDIVVLVKARVHLRSRG